MSREAVEAAMDRMESILNEVAFITTSEKLLQESMAEVLAKHDLSHRREHRLDAASTLDFYLPPSRLAVEVKTKGALSALTRQLSRYAQHEAVAGLLLVTTRRQLRGLPAELHGKPLRVHALDGGLA